MMQAGAGMLKVLTNDNIQYNGQNQKTVEDLESLLIGKKEPEIVQPERQELQELGARTNEADCAAGWKDT